MVTEMKTSLCGIELDNPVMAASGTFGYGLEFAAIYDINILEEARNILNDYAEDA